MGVCAVVHTLISRYGLNQTDIPPTLQLCFNTGPAHIFVGMNCAVQECQLSVAKVCLCALPFCFWHTCRTLLCMSDKMTCFIFWHFDRILIFFWALILLFYSKNFICKKCYFWSKLFKGKQVCKKKKKNWPENKQNKGCSLFKIKFKEFFESCI